MECLRKGVSQVMDIVLLRVDQTLCMTGISDPQICEFDHFLKISTSYVLILLCQHSWRKIHPMNRDKSSISQSTSDHSIAAAQVQDPGGDK